MCNSLNVKWVDDMPEDLKALAEVVEEWPEHEYAVDVQVHDGGRVVGTDWNDNGKYHKEEWRAARSLMEVCPVETEAEEEAWEKMEAKQAAEKDRYSEYHKDVGHLNTVDVYRVVDLFGCERHGHPISHAVKKLLMTGNRTGGKDVETDVQEAIVALQRWLEMRSEDRCKQ